MLTKITSDDINSLSTLNNSLATNTITTGIRKYIDNAIDAARHWTQTVIIHKVPVTDPIATDIVFDPSGNMYWAVVGNGVSSAPIPAYTATGTIYRITADGSVTICAKVTLTNRVSSTAIVYNPITNSLYWAIGSTNTSTTVVLQSVLYKVNPAGTGIVLTTPYLSMTTYSCASVALAVNPATGYIYWAVANSWFDGSYNRDSKVYEVTGANVFTVYCTKPTNGASGTSLVFDGGVLYWSITSSLNAQAANVYRITSSSTATTIVTFTTNFAKAAKLIMHPSGDLYWAVADAGSADIRYTIPNTQQNSYIYKIELAPIPSNPATVTVFAKRVTMQAIGTSLALDSNGDFYWALPQTYLGTGVTYSVTCYVYHIDSGTGKITTLSSFPYAGAGDMCIKFSPLGHLFWSIMRMVPFPVSHTNSQYIAQISKLRRF